MAKGKFPRVFTERGVTAKIYRGATVKGGRTYESFTLVWHTPEGRQRRAFADLPSAELEAGRVLSDILSGKAQAAGAVSSADAELLVAARRIAAEIGKPLIAILEDAQTGYATLAGRSTLSGAADHWMRTVGDTVTPKLIPEVVSEFLADRKKEGCSHRYLGGLKSRLNAFLAAFPARCMHEVVSREIVAWVKSGKSATDKKHRLGAVGTLAAFARAKGYLPSGAPLESTKAREELWGRGKRRRAERETSISIYSPAELRRILFGSPECPTPLREDLTPYVCILAFSGVRPDGEFGRLQWENIRLADRVIDLSVGTTKTASRRVIPISENLARWLEPYAGRRGPVAPFKVVRRAFARRCADVGVAAKRNGLRHSFGSYRCAVLKDVAATSLEMGNSPKMVLSHYREAVSEGVAREWWAINPQSPADNVIRISAAG